MIPKSTSISTYFNHHTHLKVSSGSLKERISQFMDCDNTKYMNIIDSIYNPVQSYAIINLNQQTLSVSSPQTL